MMKGSEKKGDIYNASSGENVLPDLIKGLKRPGDTISIAPGSKLVDKIPEIFSKPVREGATAIVSTNGVTIVPKTESSNGSSSNHS